jgi:hypothetical protein
LDTVTQRKQAGFETTLGTALLLARLDTPSADPTTSGSGWREDDFFAGFTSANSI